MPRAKKNHGDYCFEVCVCCLHRPKVSLRTPLVTKNGANCLENLLSSLVYPKFFQELSLFLAKERSTSITASKS